MANKFKRKAILIGNTNGLAGVQVDISRFRRFLKSSKGGAWNDGEIEILQNETKESFLKKIELLKVQSFDFVILLFSGHGGQERETILELNGNGETIEETSLRQIAKRQVNIYDCCRSFPETKIAMESLSSYPLIKSLNDIHVRERYEERIMQAIPQQVLLYACSIGETATDTRDGGVYLSRFLDAAEDVEYNQEFKLVSIAHQQAMETTKEYCEQNNASQTPDAIIPKCLSSRQLIISINPTTYV